MNSNTNSEIQQLKEEQFCQAFEIKAMADLLIRKETERWVSGFSDVIVEEEHSSRYVWVSDFVRDKRVLDIACGTGKGTFTLAQVGNAGTVVGCDLDGDAIKYASIRNKHHRVSFVVNDAQQFSDDNKYDVIVSFETIEHLTNVDAYLRGMAKLLTKDGYFYVSTPISRKALDSKPENTYHVQEWGFNEFQNLISNYFTIEEIYIQMRFENYAYAHSRFKRRILTAIERKNIRIVKEKYLCNEKIMRPVKYDNRDSVLFERNCGVTGLQILVLRSKIGER